MLQKKKLKFFWICLLAMVLLVPAFSAKAVPSVVNYQGRLSDTLNVPLSGQYDFRFRLYDDATKTTLLWGPEEHLNQTVNNGYFSVQLGSIETFAAAGLDFVDQYWLTLEIKETAAGVWDTETDPPVQFSSYAYALNADKVVSNTGEVNVGGAIQAGAALIGAENALSINTGAGFTGDLFSLANNSNEYFRVDAAGDVYLTNNRHITMTNSTVNDLIGLKIVNTNDADNYAGSVLELKGSGADYTNNVYFGKYGDGFWVNSWAGNGVLATDKDLVISAVGASSNVLFQVGGGYTTPNNIASLTAQGFEFFPYGVLSGNTGNVAFRELTASGTDSVKLKAPDTLAADVVLTLPETDGDAGQLLSTDGSGVLSWTSGGSATEVSDLNLTVATVDGNFSYSGESGYAAANLMCEDEYPGSHFCVTNEVITVIRTGDISLWSGTAWIAEGPPGYTANSNDCNGWTSALMTNLGAFWEFNNTTGGMGWLTNCASVKPVACCQ